MARKVDKEGTLHRKAEILKAAGECFSRRGFHQSSMADICKAAGLSPGTVYHYFRSKDEIVLHFAQQELEESRKYAEVLTHVDSLEGMVDVILDAIFETGEYEEMQFYLEVLCEGGRNAKVGRVLAEADEVFFRALCRELKRLATEVRGSSITMAARYIMNQIGALEIFKLERPSVKESREMAGLSRKAMLHILNEVL